MKIMCFLTHDSIHIIVHIVPSIGIYGTNYLVKQGIER